MRGVVFALAVLVIFFGCDSYDARLIKTFLVSDIFKKNSSTSISYEGYAFDALINGVPVIEIGNKEKIKSLKGYRDIASVRWRLLKPIAVNPVIAIDIKKRRIHQHDIGKLDSKNFDISYHPLGNVKIETTMVQGHKTEILPKGDYVFSLTARGSENWDRKEIFVEIREESNASKFL